MSLSSILIKSNCPIIVGRLNRINNEEYLIEISNNGIPFKYIEINQIEEWGKYPVVIDDQSFIDSLPN